MFVCVRERERKGERERLRKIEEHVLAIIVVHIKITLVSAYSNTNVLISLGILFFHPRSNG